MANYESVFLSNYFLIKDRNEFNKFIDSLICNDEIDIYESNDDPLYIAFGAYSCIPIMDYEKDNSITFETELQKHIAPGHVAIITSIGHEKLNEVNGYGLVISPTTIKEVSFEEILFETGQDILHADLEKMNKESERKE